MLGCTHKDVQNLISSMIIFSFAGNYILVCLSYLAQILRADLGDCAAYDESGLLLSKVTFSKLGSQDGEALHERVMWEC